MREILIKIPDEIYQSVIDGTYCGSLYKEIKNGTPLPDHHGRLIDADKLESHDEYDGQGFTKSVYKDDIDSLPTIIEGE